MHTHAYSLTHSHYSHHSLTSFTSFTSLTHIIHSTHSITHVLAPPKGHEVADPTAIQTPDICVFYLAVSGNCFSVTCRPQTHSQYHKNTKYKQLHTDTGTFKQTHRYQPPTHIARPHDIEHTHTLIYTRIYAHTHTYPHTYTNARAHTHTRLSGERTGLDSSPPTAQTSTARHHRREGGEVGLKSRQQSHGDCAVVVCHRKKHSS